MRFEEEEKAKGISLFVVVVVVVVVVFFFLINDFSILEFLAIDVLSDRMTISSDSLKRSQLFFKVSIKSLILVSTDHHTF